MVDVVNLQGTLVMPTALITGGHGGIGLQAAAELAGQWRFDLVLAGRDPTRVAAVAERLQAEHGIKVAFVEMDTSSLASVRQAVTRLSAMLRDGEIDCLQAILCNAGARIEPLRFSPEGYEETFATNYLGHFLLVELLIDRLTETGRVVFTASGTHDPDKMDGKIIGGVGAPDAIRLAHDGKLGRKPSSAGKRYSTSKLCTVLGAYELDRRLRQRGSSIVSIAFDPGSVPSTGFLRGMPKPVQWLAKTRFFEWLSRRLGITIGNLEFSGASLGRLAADPAYSNASGKYFQSNDGKLTEVRSSTTSYDGALAAKLWMDSRRMVGLDRTEELHSDDDRKTTGRRCGDLARCGG